MELDFWDVILIGVLGYLLLVISWGVAFHQWGFPLNFLNKARVSKVRRNKEKDEAKRRSAYYRELSRLKKGKDALGIIELLKIKDVRYHAVRALGELKAPAAVGPLVMELENPDNYLGDVLGIIDALKKIGAPSIEPMTKALFDEHLSLDVREELIKTLGDMKATHAIDSLINLLQKEHMESIRKATFKSLKRITGISFGEHPEKWSEWWEQRHH